MPEQYVSEKICFLTGYVIFGNLTFLLPANVIYPADVFRQIGIDVG